MNTNNPVDSNCSSPATSEDFGDENKPDISTIILILQALGFQLEKFHINKDYFKSDKIKIELSCGKSQMEGVLSMKNVKCSCPNKEKQSKASFWKVTGTDPAHITNVKYLDSGSNLLPKLSDQDHKKIKHYLDAAMKIIQPENSSISKLTYPVDRSESFLAQNYQVNLDESFGILSPLDMENSMLVDEDRLSIGSVNSNCSIFKKPLLRSNTYDKDTFEIKTDSRATSITSLYGSATDLIQTDTGKMQMKEMKKKVIKNKINIAFEAIQDLARDFDDICRSESEASKSSTKSDYRQLPKKSSLQLPSSSSNNLRRKSLPAPTISRTSSNLSSKSVSSQVKSPASKSTSLNKSSKNIPKITLSSSTNKTTSGSRINSYNLRPKSPSTTKETSSGLGKMAVSNSLRRSISCTKELPTFSGDKKLAKAKLERK